MAATYAEARETIIADPHAIYALISDLTCMGNWSPEAAGGKWVKGACAPVVGAVFRGKNASGWRRWSTLATVIEADPGKRFAFHVTAGGIPIADWAYEFVTDNGTTTVLETWSDCRPVWMAKASALLMGVSDRAVHNQRTMALTLTALKKAAESAT